MADRFDAAYYRRFYGRSPVHGRRQIANLAEGVVSLASWWRNPIRSVLDVGAGKGYWRDWLAESHPTVRYHGLDASEYACSRYDHELAPVFVDERHYLGGRGSSSRAKKAVADFKISLARRSSRFSRSSSLSRSRSSLVNPGRCPASTSAARTQTRNVS
jgi:hypothetical protein